MQLNNNHRNTCSCPAYRTYMKHNKIDRCIFLDIELKFAEIKTINRLAKHYNVDNVTIKNVLIEAGLDPYFYKKQENEIRNQAAEYY